MQITFISGQLIQLPELGSGGFSSGWHLFDVTVQTPVNALFIGVELTPPFPDDETTDKQESFEDII